MWVLYQAKSIVATTWHMALSWGEDAPSMRPLPMMRTLTRELICCTHLYFCLLCRTSFFICLEMYATCVSDKSYKMDK